MSSSVNLILERRKRGLNRVRVHTILNTLAVICVLIVIVLCGAIYFFQKDPTYTDLQLQKGTLNQSLTILKDKAVLLFTVKKRLASLTTIIKARKSYDQTLYTLMSTVPSGVQIDTYSLSPKVISLTISSPSLLSLNSYIDIITSDVNKKQLFGKVTIDNFILDDKQGRYSVGMTMNLL